MFNCGYKLLIAEKGDNEMESKQKENSGKFRSIKFFGEHKSVIKSEVLSGLTVALALIPESIAFAFVAGVSPILSLQTAVVIGLVAATFTGRPGMISSSTAAIAVVVALCVVAIMMRLVIGVECGNRLSNDEHQ